VLEAGPDSYIATKPAITELAAELSDLKSELIGSSDERRRVYIVRENRFVDMPKGMSMMVPGNMNAAIRSPLFSTETKFRFVTELFLPRQERQTDISVQELVVSHFGEEMLEYVTEPLLSGVYGGDSARLSAESVLPRFLGYERTYGSLIRGVRRERTQAQQTGSLFLSFKRGMQTITDALAAEISGDVAVLQARVSSAERTANGWRVNCSDEYIDATELVLAVPAHAAAEILSNAAPTVANELQAIPYSSAILVTAVYRSGDADLPEGFGFLVPRKERQTIAATTFVGTKWPSRIPNELVALRAFIVNPEAPQLLDRADAELLQLMRRDFKRLLTISSDPLFCTIERWPNSMPQYIVGHSARQNRIKEALLQFPGLFLTGNAYDGVGLPDCVRLAKQTASAIAGKAHKLTVCS
jgi:oxygen-dependent protoporphyrinogen oxidase